MNKNVSDVEKASREFMGAVKNNKIKNKDKLDSPEAYFKFKAKLRSKIKSKNTVTRFIG